MDVILTLMPVFLVVALGWLLRTIGFLSRDFFLGMNKLTFWVGLPCLLFEKVSSAVLAPAVVGRISLNLFFALIAGIILAYLVAWGIRIPKESWGTFVQIAFRGNLAYVGLPVIYYALAARGEKGVEAAIQTATLAMAPMIIIYNIAAVLVLLRRTSGEGKVWRQMIFSMVTNPLLLSIFFALPFCLFRIPLPAAIQRSVHALGAMALPLALLSIGASLSRERLKGSLKVAGIASLLKVGATPLVGYLAVWALNMEEVESLIAMIFHACPTAVASYVMAERLGGDEALAGNGVILSTLFSGISLSLVVAIFGV